MDPVSALVGLVGSLASLLFTWLAIVLGLLLVIALVLTVLQWALLRACIRGLVWLMWYAMGWPMQPDTFGSAHWQSWRERRRSGLVSTRPGIILGRVGHRTLRDAGPGHVLLCGPSRSGKGLTTVLPTLYELPWDVVCVDPKGENAQLTAAWRIKKGSAVHLFDPLGSGDHTSIELLSTIRMHTPMALSDADLLARTFIPDPGPEHPEARYYSKDPADILSACLLFVLEAEPDKTLGGVLRFMTSHEPAAKRLQRMTASTHAAVRATAGRYLPIDRYVYPRLWSAAVSALSLWRDPLIDERTRANGLELTIDGSRPPLTLYLRSPEGQSERLGPLFRAIAQTIIARRMEGTPERGKRPCVLLLDEFGSMGLCTPLINALPRMAGYGLRCLFVAQDLTDLRRIYGPDNNLIANCDTRLFHTPNDVNTALYVSRLLGLSTRQHIVTHDGQNFSFQSSSESHSEGLVESGRSLMTVDEVLRLPKTDVLVFPSGQAPIVAKKIGYADAAYQEARSVAHASSSTQDLDHAVA
jgi:type IV secretion system protein VirD4